MGRYKEASRCCLVGFQDGWVSGMMLCCVLYCILRLMCFSFGVLVVGCLLLRFISSNPYYLNPFPLTVITCSLNIVSQNSQ